MELLATIALLTTSSVVTAAPTFASSPSSPSSPNGEAPLPTETTPRAAARGDDRGVDPKNDELRPGTRIVATADTAFRMAPLGAALVTGVYVRQTYGVDPSGRYESSYLQGGAGVMVTPASIEPQLHAEYVPAPYLVLRAELGGVRYFGANYGLLSFDDANAAFRDSELSARRGDAHGAWAMKGSFSLTPRLKLGPVHLHNKLRITAFHFDDHGPYVYEAENDTLLATTDVVLSSRTDVLAEVFGGPGARTFMLGPM